MVKSLKEVAKMFAEQNAQINAAKTAVQPAQQIIDTDTSNSVALSANTDSQASSSSSASASNPQSSYESRQLVSPSSVKQEQAQDLLELPAPAAHAVEAHVIPSQHGPVGVTIPEGGARLPVDCFISKNGEIACLVIVAQDTQVFGANSAEVIDINN